jgi:small redox-active disulfide protein 2
MDIKVLGPGCAKCRKLYAETDKAAKELGIAVQITKVETIEEIMKYNVLMTPALVINGVVKVAGRIPPAAELANLLTTAAPADEKS